MSKAPLRPATPIDTELAEPRPDEETEVGKANKMAEKYQKPPHPIDKDEEASKPAK